jgi:hypothetical protein
MQKQKYIAWYYRELIFLVLMERKTRMLTNDCHTWQDINYSLPIIYSCISFSLLLYLGYHVLHLFSFFPLCIFCFIRRGTHLQGWPIISCGNERNFLFFVKDTRPFIALLRKLCVSMGWPLVNKDNTLKIIWSEVTGILQKLWNKCNDTNNKFYSSSQTVMSFVD